jgi:1-acyl-sn-glycerol-3-phosphate acyltransferase
LQYQLSRVVAGPFLRTMGRPSVSGLENIPPTGAAVLASNHLSIIDSVYLPLMVPRPVVFPAKAEYFNARGPVGRLWAAYLRSTNQLAINRDGARAAQETLDAAVEILRAGELFGFYPEGTRSPDGKLYRGRSGIGYLALNSGAPVIPVAMLGTRTMMPPGRSYLVPAKIKIKIGPPMTFEDLAGVAPAKARREVADRVMTAIRELSGQEYVHIYASDRKAEIAAAAQKPKD